MRTIASLPEAEAAADRAGDARHLRAARAPARHRRREVAARGPRVRGRCTRSATPRSSRSSTRRRPSAQDYLEQPAHRAARPARRAAHRRRGARPAEALLVDLREDGRQGQGVRRGPGPRRHPRRRRVGEGLLRRARLDPRVVAVRCRAGSRTTSRCPSSTSTSRCTRRSSGPAAGSSRCRSAPRRCTAGPSSASPRTGATRSATVANSADDLAWLQRMVDWQQETDDPAEFMQSLKIDLEQDEVFVFTPKGKVVTLPTGRQPGRLRLRDPHRGRAPLHRRPGERPARAARLDAGVGRHRRDLHEQGRGRGPEPRLAAVRADAAGPDEDPPVVLPRAARGRDRRRPRRAGQGAAQGEPARPELAVAAAAARSPSSLHYADVEALHAAIGEGHVSGTRRRAAGARASWRGGEEQIPVTARRPARSSARRRSRRRPRRGARRRPGPALTLLHAGARRRDHRLRHPRPRRVGAPHRLRERRRPRQPGRAAHRGRVGPRPARRPTSCRSRSRRSTGPGSCATSPRRSPTTT